MKETTSTRRCLCIIGLLLFNVHVHAHHGGATYWIMDTKIGPVTGTATKFGFSFPHVSIYMDIADDDGKVQNYVMSIRWTPTVLRKLGWTRKSIKPGDQLTVTYIPHKQNATVGALLSLKVNGETLKTSPPGSENELEPESGQNEHS